MIAWFELRYVPADHFNLTGHIAPSRVPFG
jgi:hypothetical protein